MARLCSVGLLLFGLVRPGFCGQLGRSSFSNAAAGSVTLIATLETLGITIAPIDRGNPLSASRDSGYQSYAVTTTSAIVAYRTTVHLGWVVRGNTNAKPQSGAILPAMKSDAMHPSIPVTNLLDIRMDMGTPLQGKTHLSPEDLEIVAEAL